MLAQYIIKVSKLCNLRCTYCYEYPELGNPARMSVEQLDTMFAKIAHQYRNEPDEAGVRFIWHGGEPLLQPPSYYREIFVVQKKRFGDRYIVNDVQTNLMKLDAERVELLRSGFNGVGVSIDVFGGLRLNLAGAQSQSKVLKNMECLRKEGVPFGCITVLTRKNLEHVEQIFHFYEALGSSFRLLPLFRAASEDQNAGYEVTAHEVLRAMCRLADLWLASETKIRIDPITTQLRHLLVRGSPYFIPDYYDRRTNESIILVNTNGDLYAQADAFKPGLAWGNVFDSSFDTILLSDERARSVLRAEKRMAAACVHCEYFGACDGFPIAEDNRLYPDTMRDNRDECVIERGLYRHLERRLQAAEGPFGPDVWGRLEQMVGPSSIQPPLAWADVPEGVDAAERGPLAADPADVARWSTAT